VPGRSPSFRRGRNTGIDKTKVQSFPGDDSGFVPHEHNIFQTGRGLFILVGSSSHRRLGWRKAFHPTVSKRAIVAM